jgi:hypothetical protein
VNGQRRAGAQIEGAIERRRDSVLHDGGSAVREAESEPIGDQVAQPEQREARRGEIGVDRVTQVRLVFAAMPVGADGVAADAEGAA